jgi:hypothetical protein
MPDGNAMRLEHLCLELRRRSPWEAMDLGLPVLRRWAGPVYRAWFATVVPFILLLAFLCWENAWLAAVLGWWLKPLYDRILLKVYAEALFDEPPGIRAVWRALPRLVFRSGLLSGLTLGRLDMARSFHLPIVQLEGQHGRAARQRRRVLDRRTRGCAVWLTFVCAHFSIFMQFSVLILLELFRPQEAPPLFDWEGLVKGEQDPLLSFLANLAWLAGETLVEPFYVAAGFTLYLNRRNDLEGWDIELGFRRLAERFETGDERRGRPGRLVAGLVLALLAAPWSFDGHAAPAPAAASPERQAIREVLADPVFGRQVDDWGWKYRERKKEDKEADRSDSWLVKFIESLAEWLSEGVRLFSFLVGAILVAALAVLVYRYRDRWLAPQAPDRTVPEFLFGLDVRPESLPEDVAAAARRHLAAGEFALALSLLYRGALVVLIHAEGVDFRPGDTEGDCLRRVQGRIDAAASGYFAELLGAWQLTAYAHHAPPGDRLRELCERWPNHFATGGRVAP